MPSGFVCTHSKWQAESSCFCSRCKCFSGDWIPTQERPSRGATWPCSRWQCLPSPGPGAMMAVILLTDNDVYTVPQQAETGVVLLVVLLVTYIFLRFSDIILRVIGQQGAAVLVRVMGIILASLAVEIVLTALAVGSWGPAPTH